jgi:hypothetical protein
MALELIICLLDVLKNDFREVQETIFQGDKSPCELILCFLDIKISDFDEVP